MSKHYLLIAVILLCSSSLVYSQDAARVNEFGLRFSNFYGFGLAYKTGKESNLWRFSTGSLSVVFDDRGDGGLKLQSYQIGVLAGYENRVRIDDRIRFVHGPEVGFSFYQRRIFEAGQNNTLVFSGYRETTLSPSLGYILGLNYSINPNLLLSAELIPSISFRSHRKPFEENDRDLNFRFGTSTALLTLAYRIIK